MENEARVIERRTFESIVFVGMTIVFAGINKLAAAFEPKPFFGEDTTSKLYRQKGVVTRFVGVLIWTLKDGVWTPEANNIQYYDVHGSLKQASQSSIEEILAAAKKAAVSLDFSKTYNSLGDDFLAAEAAKAKAAAINSAKAKVDSLEAEIATQAAAIEAAKVSLEEQKTALEKAMIALEALTAPAFEAVEAV